MVPSLQKLLVREVKIGLHVLWEWAICLVTLYAFTCQTMDHEFVLWSLYLTTPVAILHWALHPERDPRDHFVASQVQQLS
jgi:hypothetical protein